MQAILTLFLTRSRREGESVEEGVERAKTFRDEGERTWANAGLGGFE